MLKQLPITGDWIDPRTIHQVFARDGEVNHVDPTKPWAPSVQVNYGARLDVGDNYSWYQPRHSHYVYTIRCESYEQAKQIRDEVAGWCNTPEEVKTSA